MTSAEAARAIAEAVQRYNELLSLPLYAVGAATAEAARKLGFRDIHVSKADGIALAVDIAARRNVGEGPLLYLAGEPRSPGLESELSARHIPLSVVVCYRMQPIDHAPADLDRVWRSGDETAVLLYSRQAAMRFARLVQASPPDATRLLCLSPAIAEALPDTLRHLAKAPNTPTEDALLTLLDRP
jgi:uroporphyrinogen-III synthase